MPPTSPDMSPLLNELQWGTSAKLAPFAISQKTAIWTADTESAAVRSLATFVVGLTRTMRPI